MQDRLWLRPRAAPCSYTRLVTRCARRTNSLLRPREITQVRRRLILAHRHQQTIGAHIVVFVADAHMTIAFRTDELAPCRARRRITLIFPNHRPRPCQRVVDDRDLVMQDAGIVLVEIEALLE